MQNDYRSVRIKVGLPLENNLLTPLVKSELIPLGLIPADSAPDAGIHKFLGSRATTLIVSNKEMRDYENNLVS